MADLIERKPLYERAARLEAEALDEASKLIERGRVGEVTSEDWRIWSAVLAERTAFKHDVIDAPSAEPKRNKGERMMHSDYPDRFICSECGAQFDVWHWESEQMHFCPNCGAEMG